MSSQFPPLADTIDDPNIGISAKSKAKADKTSKNPYRRALTTPVPTLSRSVSQETQSSSLSRPVRAVFYDLPTAHSSITSGLGRSKQHAPSNAPSETYDEEDSIPLQEFEPLKRTKPISSFLQELPLPPPPAATIQHRLNKHSSTSDFSLDTENNKYASEQYDRQARDKSKARPPPLKQSSVYHTSLNAPPSSFPPSSIGFKNSGRIRKHNHESYAAAISSPDLGSTPTRRQSPLTRQSTKTSRILSNDPSSLPEGSTVGNIYRHYAQSDIFDDRDSFSHRVIREHELQDDDRPDSKRQSALDLRKQRRADRRHSSGQPPTSALPKVPKPLPPRLLQSSSQGVGQSSSYGDTRNLLELTDQSPLPPSQLNGTNDVLPDHAISELSTTRLPYKDPEPLLENTRGPPIHISEANDDHDGYDDYRSYVNQRERDRQPLEREVSEALRRASNFSAFSDGSISTSVVRNYKYYQNDGSPSERFGATRSAAEARIDQETRADAAHARAFYDREAIPAMWMSDNQHNMVRIPIQRNQLPKTPPVTPEDGFIFELENKHGEDVNDWETVGESGVGSEHMLGEDIAHRTGSSIADTSDDGSVGTRIPEMSDFGSTERIAQHPGNIHYSGDYRQRDLKNGKMPVFLPVYGEHKVNGYLADSTRLRAPPSPYNFTPRPLKRQHTNPFKSPPPTIANKNFASRPYSSRQRPFTKPNHFPAQPSINTNSSVEEDPIVQRRKSRKQSGIVENFSRPFDWMDGFGDPGPALRTGRPPGDFLRPIPQVTESEDRPSSWQHIMAFARGEPVPGYNADGSRKDGYRFGRDSFREHSFSGEPLTSNDGFIEAMTYGGKRDPISNGERSTLVKGPPGAFYHGISKADQSLSKNGRTRKHKPSVRRKSLSDPDGLRTLSLVGRQGRTLTPSMKSLMDIGADPSLSSRPNDFVYRSPRAPPRRKTWQMMYTDEQLAGFREAARMDGVIDEETSAIELESGFSSRHLGEEPHLWGGQQRQREKRFFHQPGPISMEQPKRRKEISIYMLCLCNLFFPLLLLYSHGTLDSAMYWWSTGEFYAFGRPQKRIALFCFIGWCAVSCFAVVSVLIWWFAIRMRE